VLASPLLSRDCEANTINSIGYGVAVTSMTLTHQPGVRLPVSEKLPVLSRDQSPYFLDFSLLPPAPVPTSVLFRHSNKPCNRHTIIQHIRLFFQLISVEPGKKDSPDIPVQEPEQYSASLSVQQVSDRGCKHLHAHANKRIRGVEYPPRVLLRREERGSNQCQTDNHAQDHCPDPDLERPLQLGPAISQP
jgi:hypothetical protein